jgi:hypothetical protein
MDALDDLGDLLTIFLLKPSGRSGASTAGLASGAGGSSWAPTGAALKEAMSSAGIRTVVRVRARRRIEEV